VIREIPLEEEKTYSTSNDLTQIWVKGLLGGKKDMIRLTMVEKASRESEAGG